MNVFWVYVACVACCGSEVGHSGVPEATAERLLAAATSPGDQVSVRQEIEALMRANPSWPHGERLLGLSFYTTGQYSRAQPFLQYAVTQNETDLELQRVYAWCAYHIGMYDEALMWCEKVLERLPHQADMMLGLGMVHVQLADRQVGQQWLERAIAHGDDQPDVRNEARIQLANVLSQSGQASASQACLVDFISENPNAQRGYAYLDRTLRRDGRLRDAARAARVVELLKLGAVFRRGQHPYAWPDERLAESMYSQSMRASHAQRHYRAVGSG